MLDVIKARYSCRKFTGAPVKEEDLHQILEAGRWAPSGLNNQPWRFFIVQNDPVTQEKLATLTTSGKIIRQAPVNIVVLLDLATLYHREKDIQGIGACIQNMLLAAHVLGYGTCWLGQILNNASQVLEVLELDPARYELMAVISIGVPQPGVVPKKRDRKPLSELILSPLDS